MSRITRWMDRRFYPDHSDFWDDSLFRREIRTFLDPAATVLDLGAGSGFVPQMNFRGEVRKVCGVDPDAAVLRNPYLDEARVAGGEAIPYPDETFDLVFADNVLEHLPDPPRVFAEVARVLVPGGFFLAKTPNFLHYIALIARCSPHGFHEWVRRLRGVGEENTFPTLYRANSRRQIARAAAAAGLNVRSIAVHEGRPEYLRLYAPTYLAGLAYERLVNSTRLLAGFRSVLLAVLEKPPRQEPAATATPTAAL